MHSGADHVQEAAGTRGTGRRDRNHERLYRAALDLFVERGYDATTMDDIAARAGTARRTVFNHFPAKKDLTVEWADRRRSDALVAAGSEAGAPARLRACFHELGTITARRPVETEQMLRGWLAGQGPIRHRTELPDVLRPWIEEGRRDGSIAAHVDPQRAADLLHDVYLGVLFRWIGETESEPERIVPDLDAAVDLVLAGLT